MKYRLSIGNGTTMMIQFHIHKGDHICLYYLLCFAFTGTTPNDVQCLFMDVMYMLGIHEPVSFRPGWTFVSDDHKISAAWKRIIYIYHPFFVFITNNIECHSKSFAMNHCFSFVIRLFIVTLTNMSISISTSISYVSVWNIYTITSYRLM